MGVNVERSYEASLSRGCLYTVMFEMYLTPYNLLSNP